MTEVDNNMMGGFSTGIDGEQGETNVMDHAACADDVCNYNTITQLSGADGSRRDTRRLRWQLLPRWQLQLRQPRLDQPLFRAT